MKGKWSLWPPADSNNYLVSETESVPSGLKPSRGLSTITKLAQSRNRPGLPKRHRLYVIEVTGADDVDFYVGQTTRLVENRLKQHQSRELGQGAAQIFRKFRGTAQHLRYDLFEGLPYFTDKKVAEQAEGILADVIEAQLRAKVDCDVLRTRKRAAARKSGTSPAKKATARG